MAEIKYHIKNLKNRTHILLKLSRVLDEYTPSTEFIKLFKNKKILIFYPNYLSDAFRFLIIGAMLSKAKAKVYYLADEGCLFEINNSYKYSKKDILEGNLFIKNRFWPPKMFLYNIQRKVGDIYLGNIFKKYMYFINLSELLKGFNLSDKNYKKYEKYINNRALEGTKRYFQDSLYKMDEVKEAYFNYEKQNAKKVIYSFMKFKNQYGPIDFVFMVDGVYTTHGIIFDLCRKEKINKFVIAALGYRVYYDFCSDESPQTQWRSKKFKEFVNESLSKEEEKIISEYLSKRTKNISYENKIYFPKQDKLNLMINRKKPTFGLFPNVIWDGDNCERCRVFDSIVKFAVETIKFFYENKNIGNLIIRFHPSESTLLQFSKKFEDVLKEILDKKYFDADNIYFIPSDNYINSYKLIKNYVEVVLMYDGFIGIESIYLGKPVISVANWRFVNQEICFEPKTKEEYFNMLKSPDKFIKKFNRNYPKIREKLFKALYFYLFKSTIHSPIVHTKGEFAKLSINDLKQIEKDLIDITKFYSYDK